MPGWIGRLETRKEKTAGGVEGLNFALWEQRRDFLIGKLH